MTAIEQQELKPLVSIIVPIYNAEKYLRQLLDSIIAQTYKNIEIILINDGSTDSSRDICKAYSENDNRIVFLDKDNSGVASSRNCGLNVIKGKYIQFADSDDILEPSATESLVAAAESTGCDLVVAAFYRVINDKIYLKMNIRKNEFMSLRKYAEYMMQAPSNFYYGVLWNKLFKGDIIRNNALSFDYGLSWGEDFVFILKYLEYVRTVMAIKTPIYHYFKRSGSLCSTQIMKKNAAQIKKQLFDSYKDLYIAIDMYTENRLRIQSYVLSMATDGGKGDEKYHTDTFSKNVTDMLTGFTRPIARKINSAQAVGLSDSDSVKKVKKSTG